MNKTFLAVAALTLAISGGQAALAASTEPSVSAETPLNARALDEVKDLSKQLLTLANKHDVPASSRCFGIRLPR